MQRSGQDPPQTCTIGTSARAPTTASPTRHHTAHIYSSFHRRSKSHVTAVLLAVAFERLRRLVPRHRRDIPTVPVLLYHAVHVQGFEKHGIVLIYMSGRGLRGTRRACSITARTLLLNVVAPPDSFRLVFLARHGLMTCLDVFTIFFLVYRSERSLV